MKIKDGISSEEATHECKPFRLLSHHKGFIKLTKRLSKQKM